MSIRTVRHWIVPGCRWAAADGAASYVLSESDREALVYFPGNIAALHRARSRRSWTRGTCACVGPGRVAWGNAVPLPSASAAPPDSLPHPAVSSVLRFRPCLSGIGSSPRGSGEKTEEIVETWVDDGVLPVRGRGAKRGAARGAGVSANCAQLRETE